MTLDQLRLLVIQAAEEIADRHPRPFPVTVVVPLEGSTRVLSLEAFPEADEDRHAALSVLAATHMVPENAACFGFLSEADGPGGEDLVVAVYGARRRGTFLAAALVDEDGLIGVFGEAEPLEPAAMPFVQPLQHAADMAAAPEDGGRGLPLL